MKRIFGILVALYWALEGAFCRGEETPSAPEHIRLRPSVSPTMPAAAREVALDVAEAMAAQKLSRAVITTPQEAQSSVITAFLQRLDESGLRVALSSPKARVMSEFRRVYSKFLAKPDESIPIPAISPDTCAIRIEHKGDEDHGTILAKVRGPLSLDLKQPYTNRGWVTQAEEVIDDRGVAFVSPGSDDGIALCVGRSDPCATVDEAAAEARARLGLAIREAVFALSKEWSPDRAVGVERPGADSWLPLRQPTDVFSQRFERPYGTVYRVYHLSQLTRDDLSALGRSARTEVLAHAWVPWFRAGGLIAVTVLIALAYQLARQHLRKRWTVTLGVMSFAAWLALVAAFVLAL